MRHRWRATAAVALTGALTLAGCGTEEEQPADSGSPDTVEITFAGGTVTPLGERVEVDKGEPIELVVTADEAGTLHVHSTPEQELEYPEGTTELSLTIDTPGVVEVESHELEVTVLQLEVR